MKLRKTIIVTAAVLVVGVVWRWSRSTKREAAPYLALTTPPGGPDH